MRPSDLERRAISGRRGRRPGRAATLAVLVAGGAVAGALLGLQVRGLLTELREAPPPPTPAAGEERPLRERLTPKQRCGLLPADLVVSCLESLPRTEAPR